MSRARAKTRARAKNTELHVFANAVREVLGLAPLNGDAWVPPERRFYTIAHELPVARPKRFAE